MMSGSFIAGVSRLAGATAVAQGITIAVSPLLTRLYSPDDFGVAAVFMSIVGVVGVVSSLRYESAIPLPRTDDEARWVLAVALLATTSVALVSIPVVFFLREPVAVLFGTPRLETLLWLLPVAVMAIGGYNTVSRWTIRTRDFTLLASTKLTQAVGGAATQVTLGVASLLGPLGLVVGSIVGQSAGIARLILAMRHGPSSVSDWTPGLRAARSVATRYRRFALLSTPSALLNSITLQAPTIAIAAMYDPATAGLYAITQRTLGVPMAFLGTAVSDVFFGEAAVAVREQRTDDLMRLFRRTGTILAAVAVLLMGGLAFVAPGLFALVFGEEWREAGRFVRILAPAYAAAFIAAPFGSVLAALERQDLFAAREAFRAAAVIGSLGVAIKLDATVPATLVSLSIASTIGYAGYVAASWYAIHLHRQSVLDGPR